MFQTTHPPKVFISYSHDSQEHMERVLALANRLRSEGVDCNIDQYEISPSEGWARWMMNQLEWADFVVVVCTEQYDRRFRGKESPGIGRGVTWEGAIITQELYDSQVHSIKFVPIILSDQDANFIPVIVRGFSRYDLSTEAGYEALYRRLTNQPLSPKPLMGARIDIAPRVLSPLSTRDRKQKFLQAPNFFAYDDAWVGRENLIQELSDRIKESCRLLILVGIAGIGKTALAERIALELQDWFDGDWTKFHQENFDNEESYSDFTSVATRWLEKWGELITPEDRREPQWLLYRVITYLRENRYLVQIDSLENILLGREEQSWSSFKDEWWVRFFQNILTVETCQSRIIITSQDLPVQIEEAGTRSQTLWNYQVVRGLDEQESLALFGKTGLDVSAESEGKPYLERISMAYEGHPLALRVIAGEIFRHPFNGNVVAYWHKYGNEVEEVEKPIDEFKNKDVSASTEDKYKLDRYTTNLRIHLRSCLEETFSRLYNEVHDAYILLCEASIYRYPVPEDVWLSRLKNWDKDEAQQQIALQTLRDRYLVEELVENNQVLLRQHNLIRSVALEHLNRLTINPNIHIQSYSNRLIDGKRLENIFVPSQIPTHTFVEPSEYWRLFVALRASGRGLVIEGTSGIGKTTCVTKVLEQLSLSDKKVKKLKARKQEDREEISSLRHNHEYDIIIIDDFHKLEDTTKQFIADYMKVIADEEKTIKIVLIGINKAGNSLIKFARDLNNRIETIRFGINPEDRIIELVDKGEKALNIRFNDVLRKNIVKESYGSFHISQLLCYEACIIAKVIEKTSAIQEIQVSFDEIKKKVMQDLERDFGDVACKFARGPKFRREGRAPYFHILRWLAYDEKWSLELDSIITKYSEHRASIEKLLEKGSIENFITQNHEYFSDFIHYDSLTRILSIEDSKFVFYLRNLSWHEFALKVGYLSVTFTGSYDFALSFAGANRNIAEAIARKLTEAEIPVFYDWDEQHRILANNVEEYLAPIYHSEAQFIIALLSKDYPTRVWAKFESEQFKSRFNKGEVIPIWFSDSPPGMFDESSRIGGITYNVDDDNMESQVNYIVITLIRKLGDIRRKTS